MSLLLVLIGGTGGPVTATLTQTEQNDSLTSSAKLEIQASLTATEQNDTLSSTAVLPITASLSVTETNDTLSSSSLLAITASLSATEQDDTISSLASVGVSAPVVDIRPGGSRVFGYIPERKKKKKLTLDVKWTDEHDQRLIEFLREKDADFQKKRLEQIEELEELLRKSLYVSSQVTFSGFTYLTINDVETVRRRVQRQEEEILLLIA